MLDIDKLYKTNTAGKLRIIKYINFRQVKVQFINTGYVTTTRSANIVLGRVRDLLHPSVCGVGFIGVGDFKASVNRVHTKSYSTWKGMIDRCYGEKSLKKRPTYIGCSVHKDWHNFQNFAEWFYSNYVDGHALDKDIKVKGNKQYSPHTCMFVSVEDNTVEAHAKYYDFKNSKGEDIKVYNMREFSRNNNLNRGQLRKVLRGEIVSHRGWSKGGES